MVGEKDVAWKTAMLGEGAVEGVGSAPNMDGGGTESPHAAEGCWPASAQAP